MKSGRSGARSRQGYSLVELLVVVAMIGMFSLVTVPQFMTFLQQGKIRASVRQFNGNLRAARARAITRNVKTAVSFAPGLTPAAGLKSGQYAIFDFNAGANTWDLVGHWYRLEEPVYFLASNFDADTATDDTLHDVIFLPTGVVASMPATPTVELKTDANVPNNHCTITMSPAGSFTSVMSTD